jgi:DNA-binding protein HU-beta
MTKTDLVDVVAGKVKISKAAALEAVDAFTESITSALKKGDKVTLIGFGTFDVAKRAARTGVNPRTREKIKIKASKAPRFKAGKAFKDVVNK